MVGQGDDGKLECTAEFNERPMRGEPIAARNKTLKRG